MPPFCFNSPSNYPHQNLDALIPQGHNLVHLSPAPSTQFSCEAPSLPQPTGSPVIHSSYFPAYHSARQRAAEADDPSQGFYLCYCGAQFRHQTDFDRHQQPLRRYDSTELACPMPGCGFAGWMKADNFKTHYMRLHGKSQEEANKVIQGWRAETGQRSWERRGVVIQY